MYVHIVTHIVHAVYLVNMYVFKKLHGCKYMPYAVSCAQAISTMGGISEDMSLEGLSWLYHGYIKYRYHRVRDQ